MLQTIVTTAIVGGAIFASSACLAKPACQDLAGGVLFKDMLYGAGTGVVLTGLYLAAAKDGQDVGTKLATGTLGGAVLGFGVGGLELLLRDCSEARAEAPTGWRPDFSVAVVSAEPAAVFAWRW